MAIGAALKPLAGLVASAGRGAGRLARGTGKVGALGAAGFLGSRLGTGSAAGGVSSSGGISANDNVGSLSPASGLGGSSARPFAPPAVNDNYRRINANLNASDIDKEQLKVEIESANRLSSIDATLRNIFKFETAKAQHEVRAHRENSLEGTYRRPFGGIMSMGGQNQASESSSPLKTLATAAGLAALIGGAMHLLNRNNPGTPNGEAAQPGGWGGKLQNFTQSIGDTLTAGSYASSAANVLRPASSAAGGVARAVASNDNFLSAAKATKLVSFLKVARATPLIASAFAFVDPVVAAFNAGTPISKEVGKQTVGAIAAILGGLGGVAAGAALGAAVGSVVPVAGTLAGALFGGLGGAVASLGAEFVAEQIYDLVTGTISGAQFATNVSRGALRGVTRTPSLALGAAMGAAGAAFGALRAGTAVTRAGGGAVPAAASITPRAAATVTAVGAVGVGGATLAVNNGSRAGNPSAARDVAQGYLGRPMHDDEWTALINIVHAESSGRSDQEAAMIAGSVLNRAKDARRWMNRGNAASNGFLRQGKTVLAVLWAPNQFQPVTGTNGGPNSKFMNGPTDAQAAKIMQAIVTYLNRVPRNQTTFGSANPAAYGSARARRHLNNLRAAGGTTIGGSTFNTAMAGASTAIAPIASGARSAVSALGNAASAGAAPSYTPGGHHGEPAGGAIGQMVMPTAGTVTSNFGPRGGRQHRGVDIAGPVGTPIVAAAGGVVEHARNQGAAGNYIKIRHADGKRTLYMHLNTMGVTEGMQVEAGQRIGTMGNTGRSTGPHLHFEVRRGSDGSTAIDPSTIFPSLRRGATVTSGASGMAATGAIAASPATSTPGGRPSLAGMAPMPTSQAAPGNYTGAIVRNPYNPESSNPEIMDRSMIDSMTRRRLGLGLGAASQSQAIDNLAAAAQAHERQKTQVTVNAPPATVISQGGAAGTTVNAKTDSSAPESVQSPVMAAYRWATYWGVGD